MSPNLARNERDLLKGAVHFHRAMAAGMVVVIVMLVLLLGWVVCRERIHVVPPLVQRPYTIGAGYADRDYLLDMAGYVLNQVLTVTPESVDYNNQVVLKMAHPDGYATLKTTLDAAALRMRKERVTTVWVPRKEEVNLAAQRVQVSGRLKTYIADKLTSEHDKEYIVEFTITNSGRLYVTKIEELVKSAGVGKLLD
jgi:conjugal transfer pilus assembly protein TraE